MSTNPEKRWRCDECGTLYYGRTSARECCQPSITLGYVCPTCETFYIEKDEAIACCQTTAEELILVTAQELEAAGQGRLLP